MDLLTAPDTNYPVYIDPGWNGGKEIWTHVSLKSPNTSCRRVRSPGKANLP